MPCLDLSMAVISRQMIWKNGHYIIGEYNRKNDRTEGDRNRRVSEQEKEKNDRTFPRASESGETLQ